MLLFATLASAKIIVLEFDYANQSLECLGYSVQRGFPDDHRLFPDEGYRYELRAANGTVLDSFFFQPPDGYFYDEINLTTGEMTGGFTPFENVSFSLAAKHFGEAQKILVFKEENVVCSFTIAAPSPTPSPQPSIRVPTATPAATLPPTPSPAAEETDWKPVVQAVTLLALVALAALLLVYFKKKS